MFVRILTTMKVTRILPILLLLMTACAPKERTVDFPAVGATNTDYYVLSKPAEGEVGLYKAALNKTATGADPEEGQQGTHFKNNAFKAYLQLTTTQGVQALRFNFGGETTGVDAVEVVKPNAPIYDLSGRRVLSTVKGGVYIQNGKKFIVK